MALELLRGTVSQLRIERREQGKSVAAVAVFKLGPAQCEFTVDDLVLTTSLVDSPFDDGDEIIASGTFDGTSNFSALSIYVINLKKEIGVSQVNMKIAFSAFIAIVPPVILINSAMGPAGNGLYSMSWAGIALMLMFGAPCVLLGLFGLRSAFTSLIASQMVLNAAGRSK